MKRKRFVKLLMSEGYSRNRAARLARLVREKGLSYDEAYFELFYSDLVKLENKLFLALEEVKDSFSDLTEKLGAAINASIKVFNEYLESSQNKKGGD